MRNLQIVSIQMPSIAAAASSLLLTAPGDRDIDAVARLACNLAHMLQGSTPVWESSVQEKKLTEAFDLAMQLSPSNVGRQVQRHYRFWFTVAVSIRMSIDVLRGERVLQRDLIESMGDALVASAELHRLEETQTARVA